MRTYTFRTIIEPDDPKGYHGYVPALRGVHTCGDTIEEVRNNLQDAIRCHIEGLVKDGFPIPKEDQTIEMIQTVTTDVLPSAYA